MHANIYTASINNRIIIFFLVRVYRKFYYAGHVCIYLKNINY